MTTTNRTGTGAAGALRSSTVGDIVRRSARRFGDRTAVSFAERSWSYAELDAAVTRAAARLLEFGSAKGDRVAAYGKNSDAFLIGFLACARVGLVHVPVNYNLTGDELSYVLEQSGSTLALVDPALRDEVERVLPETELARVVPLRDAPDSLLAAAVEDTPPQPVQVDVAETDLAQLLYTSGTTSRPKGAMMTHRALVHEYLSCIVDCDMTPDDEPLHVMPLYHSAQLHVFLLPMLAIGARNTVLEVADSADILRRIERDGHRAFFAAPTLWVALANHPDFVARDLGTLRKAYYGASIMPGPVLRKLRETLPDLGFYNCFGQSEIAPLAAVLRPEEHDERPASAGRPALFVELRVVDPQGNDVALGEHGECVYRSPQLCEGYWNKPEETAEAFRDGWFHSGDLVRLDEHGYVYVVDRIKDVINTGGVMVASREVEDAIYTHPAVGEVAVVGVPDDKWIEAITAFVVLKEDRPEPDPAELTEQLRGRIAAFKLPKAVRFVSDLPRNSAGKLLKRELRDQYG